MRAIRMVLGARLRDNWRAWLALSVLVALVGGFVLAAAAAGRRTAAAFPDFVARHGYDAVVYTGHPLPQLARLPQVASVTPVLAPFAATPVCVSCRRPIPYGDFGIFEVPPRDLPHMVKLLSGRMPDQSNPGEALASYTLVRDNGVHLGSLIETPLLRRHRAGTPRRAQVTLGPRPVLRVVGIVVAQNEFEAGGSGRYDLFPTTAFAAAVNHQTPLLPVYYVRLRHGGADFAAFDSRLHSLHALGADDLNVDGAAVAGSIRPQAVGWWALAALAALAGLAVIGQAVARQSGTDKADQYPLSALGLQSRQFMVLELLRALIVGAVGAALAVALAALLSPLTPVGEARLATPAPGAVTFDALILLVGALTIVVVVVAASVPSAVRHARLRSDRPPPRVAPAAIAAAVAAIGGPPTALIGIRRAFERSHGGQEPVPVGTALLGTVLAVAALSATAVFGASLTHLVSSPALYGTPFQVYFTNPGTGSGAFITGPLLTSLRQDPAIERITLVSTPDVSIKRTHFRALAVTAVRGRPLVSAVDGRLPHGDRQILLGAATMRAVGAHPGGRVWLTVADPSGVSRRVRFRVVGRASFPSDFGTGGLGSGAAMTMSALVDAQCPAGRGQPACRRAARRGIVYAVLARAAPGPAGSAALERHIRASRGSAVRPAKPTTLINFGQAVNFPLLFGGMLSLFACATLLHLLLVSVTRRRREAGLLKVLGFVRFQVAAVVSWQATAVALVGIAVGVPLGIAVGQVVWRLFATNFGVVPVSIVHPLQLAAFAAAALSAANVLAAIPALLAARSRPGQLLRAE